ncbi:MAG: hypothetical protein COU85_01920 [Candidatus Portnoybacteria bacterium CG10_big_fil_rev_8_21_14_0_10_44_7]|uniref:DUF5673 domain-containing protein n=1 Tax=Candidatus Portnoybacteria bacterium CG10_big_fil_rev_8_21_14_0_10_44_7 TaxID=1974816 RepID=A0A2M8KIM9_9BACT|nr:MAG: hypothetical protein COU85_01920 [Candidatus Portnoybacteria bacterium CG10_big_fil_rev_8_21_14_0_10_44_7]
MKQEFIWAAEEFKKSPKNKKWFWQTGLVFAALFVLAIVFGNFFLAFLIVVSAFAFFVYALKDPVKYNFSINQDGVGVGQRFISFEDIKSFWIFNQKNSDALPEISFILKRKINNHFKIPVALEQKIIKIENFLKQYLPKKRQEESIIDVFLEKIGF